MDPNVIPNSRDGSALQEEMSRKKIKDFVKERQRALDELNARREANVGKIDERRLERERKHLEQCERHEATRKEVKEAEQRAKEEKEAHEREGLQRKALERQLEMERRQEEETRLLNEVRQETVREAKRRSEHTSFHDRERDLRLEAQRQRKRDDTEKRRSEQAAGRDDRCVKALSTILTGLHETINADAREIERHQETEREERYRLDKVSPPPSLLPPPPPLPPP